VIEVRRGGLHDPQVATLLAHHRAQALASTPMENAHALDMAGLAAPYITFWSAWAGDALAGFAALRELDARHGEVKSMRTHPDWLRRGVARALLGQLMFESRARGYARLSLETGTAPSFAAANALYEAAGFVDGPVFGGYPPSAHNRFMTLEL
jgi:putative acetyltransferase